MKRSAAKADLVLEHQEEQHLLPPRSRAGHHRSTRSTVRQEEHERKRVEQESHLETAQLQRAKDLTATPLLQALPLVLVSEYLYKHEIRNAALSSKDWKSIWVEAQHELPEYCQVEIKILGGGRQEHYQQQASSWPDWVKLRRLENVLGSQHFARSIFQKLCDLKVAVEQTEKKKQKVRDALPKWGIDFIVIHIYVWGPTASRNNGGICFTLANKVGYYGQFKLHSWSVCIDDELILWTWDSFLRWKKIYDWLPLWKCDDTGILLADEDNEAAMPGAAGVAYHGNDID